MAKHFLVELHVRHSGLHRQHGSYVVTALADGMDNVQDYSGDIFGRRCRARLDHPGSVLFGASVLHLCLEELEAWIRNHGRPCRHGYYFRLYLLSLFNDDGAVLGR